MHETGFPRKKLKNGVIGISVSKNINILMKELFGILTFYEIIKPIKNSYIYFDKILSIVPSCLISRIFLSNSGRIPTYSDCFPISS